MTGGGEEQGRTLFGVSLTDRPRWQQFFICASGFFFGYLVNGVCEEYVYNRLQFSYGWYFTFVQGFVYLALIRLQGFTMKQMVNPWRTYVRLSAVLMGSNGLTKGSLAFLNYPETEPCCLACWLVTDGCTPSPRHGAARSPPALMAVTCRF